MKQIITDMNLEKRFPADRNVIELGLLLGKVIGYQNGMLALKGVGAYANVGKWAADPDHCQRVSTGFMGFAGVYEYFVRGDCLYRVLATNPIVADNDYRMGARSHMALHLVDSDYLRVLGL